MKLNHGAVFIDNNTDKKRLLETLVSEKFIPNSKDLKFEIFSEITLKYFIENEDRFGKKNLNTENNQTIASLSGGEQKKALLQYCIAQHPHYLILDNPFDNLDVASQKNLKVYLEEISHNIAIIQIVNRKSDILTFIQNYFVVKSEFQNINIVVTGKELLGLENISQSQFYYNLPQPISSIHNNCETLVCFEAVTVKYEEKTIIKDITWQIKAGEFWQLIGPNGAGKTTILSMIIGDNPKAFGQKITLFGKPKGSGEAVWDIKKQIGYFTPSMTNLFGRSTTAEHMLVSGIFDSIGLYKIPSERQLRLANEWLKLLGFQPFKNTPFYRLTPGQQRLIMIARAMVKHPPLLILDEPTAGLDDHNALLVTTLINKIASESTTAIIYVSHRNEVGLKPEFIFELNTSPEGSTGKIITGQTA